MTHDEMRAIVELVSYKPGWSFIFGIDKKDEEGRAYVQIEVDATTEAALDAQKRDGTRVGWRGGKRYLSEFMCYQEVVGVCIGAIHDAEMHEMHEWFRFDNAAIYNHHLDPRVFAVIAKKASSFNVRDNAMVPQ